MADSGGCRLATIRNLNGSHSLLYIWEGEGGRRERREGGEGGREVGRKRREERESLICELQDHINLLGQCSLALPVAGLSFLL